MTPPTLPPEIEAAIAAAAWTVAELDRRADVMAQPEIADLRTAITSALAAAREAGRREVLEGAAGVEEAIEDHRRAAWDEALCNANTSAGAPMDVVQATFDAADALRAAIAADKARAVEAARETECASLSMRMAVICEIADEAIATASEAPDGWEQVADYRERLAKWRADRQADRAALTGAGGGR